MQLQISIYNKKLNVVNILILIILLTRRKKWKNINGFIKHCGCL